MSNGALPLPTPSPKADVTLLSVKSGWDHFVRFLGPVLWLLTHYHKDGSVHCAGEGACPSGVHRTRAIWKGYACVQKWEPRENVWRAYVLEVTEELGYKLKGHELRGEVWKLWREQEKGKRAPVRGEMVDSVDPELLREPFNLDPCLFKIYRVLPLPLTAHWPLQERLFLDDQGGPAPKGISRGGYRPKP